MICSFWLPLWYLLAVVSSAFLRYTDSDYPFGILWPLCRQFFFDIQILTDNTMAKRYQRGKSESVFRRRTDNTMAKRYQRVKSESLYRRTTENTMAKRYQRGNQNLHIEEEQLFFDIQILNTALVSFDHCFVCSSSIYRFWLPLWYILVIASSALLRYTDATRYKRGNANLYIEEEQTTHWPQDTKVIIIICISKMSRRHNGQSIPKG
jgi:hypothetical protein